MTEPAEALLEVVGLCAGYGEVPVLKNVEFSVARGEIVTILGANGAGKTTLLRAMSGLIPTSAGSIRFEGRAIEGSSCSDIVRLGIAQAPEGRRMFSGLTVEDNLKLGAFARKKTRRELNEDVEGIFHYFPRLKERRKQLAGTMSGGEQQMCAIGRALMAKPKLLMIDELSLGLAPIIVEALLDALENIHRTGASILLVEQDAAIALSFADRAVILETGRVAKVGPAESLSLHDDVIRSYLGS